MSQLVFALPKRLASPPRRRALISLTPLIDVVFILLVFFMLASSFLDWRSIALNAPAQTAEGVSMDGALLVEVRQLGLRLSGESLSLDELQLRLRARLAEDPDRPVLVRPASEVTLQQVVRVLDAVKEAGVVELSLIRGAGR
ncbi:MAG: biopolymer transporter ExbD [Rhodovibrionaceae bacterium]